MKYDLDAEADHLLQATGVLRPTPQTRIRMFREALQRAYDAGLREQPQDPGELGRLREQVKHCQEFHTPATPPWDS